jgi:hypothetical protein
MAIIELTQVGEQASKSLASGIQVPTRSGNQADTIISELHGRYYESNYQKRRFGGSMQAVIATATIAGVSTSITGVCALSNPFGSAVNVVLEKVGLGFVVATANALVFGLATGFSTVALSGTLTSLAPKSKNIGSSAVPVAALYCSAAITLPVAPTVDTILGDLGTGAITVDRQSMGQYELQGSIILPPGGFACFWTSAVLAASAHMMSWDWEECPQ